MKYHPPSPLVPPRLTLHLPGPPPPAGTFPGAAAPAASRPAAAAEPPPSLAGGAIPIVPAGQEAPPAPEAQPPTPEAPLPAHASAPQAADPQPQSRSISPPAPAAPRDGFAAADDRAWSFSAAAPEAHRTAGPPAGELVAPAIRPAWGKALLCSTCRERTCCYVFGIEVTVSDAWRIATALGVAPEVFLAYYQVEGPPRAFKLDRSGRMFRLVLERHPWLYHGYTGETDGREGAAGQAEGQAPAEAEPPAERAKACCFLVRLPSGPHLCGLGSLRPAICQHFPVSRRGTILDVYNGPGCVRAWTLAEVDYEEEVANARRFEEAVAEHERFLDEWNHYVETSLAPGENYNFNFFLDSMINWYARHQEEGQGAGNE